MLRTPKRSTGGLAAVLLGTLAASVAAQQPPAAEFVPGELIVGFKSPQALDSAVDDLKQAERSGGLAARGAKSSSVGIERLSDKSAKVSFDFRSRSGAKLAEGAELDALQDYAKLLTQQNPNVEYAHPNWVLQLHRDRIQDPVYLEDMPPDTRVQISRAFPSEPNDPVFRSGLLWHYLPPPNGMNALAAWSVSKGDKAVVVAVIDTGMLPEHPDIKASGNVLKGYDFISDPTRSGNSSAPGRSADPTDRGDACPPRLPTSSWHGTHVSGTVGAAGTNNNVGIAGVNWILLQNHAQALGQPDAAHESRRGHWRWSHPLATSSAATNEKPAASRHAASSHDFWSTLTPRFDVRDELRHLCAPPAPNRACSPNWLRIPAQNWLTFHAQYHREGHFFIWRWCHVGWCDVHTEVGSRQANGDGRAALRRHSPAGRSRAAR